MHNIKYNTIIFDLDGTLLNTLDDLMDSLNYALSKHHYPTHTMDEVRFFVGSGIKVMIERALPKDAIHFDDVYQTFVEHYEINKTNKTAPYKGAIETIQKLSEMGFKMAIVSNKYQKAVEEICKPLFGNYIHVMIGEQPGIQKKPSKDMVMLAIEKLDCQIETAIYVGDSDIDVQTAKNANIPCIGACWGFRGEELLKEYGATYIAKDFKDIIDIIQTK